MPLRPLKGGAPALPGRHRLLDVRLHRVPPCEVNYDVTASSSDLVAASCTSSKDSW
jgi:hypothetical protein